MKICMFTNTYLPHVGGVARSVDFFAEDLRKLGNHVLVVAPTFPEEVKGENEEQVLRVPAIQNFNGSDFSVRISVPFIIAGKINEFQPDIIHSHHPFLLGDAALRTARRQERPLVFTHHTLYEKYTHYVPLDSDNMKRFVINLSTEYANLCTRVVAPSRSVSVLIKDRGVTTPVEEIPTGVDLAFFKKGKGMRFRKALGIPENEQVIGHVGRLAPEKNLRYLAEAVAFFLNENPGLFLVVGGGPSEENIHRIFQDHGLEQRLILAGEKSGLKLSDAYSGMDLFVFASKTETQGMVLVEAMASGMPVIALDASGTREVVVNGKNGRLLDKNASHKAFAEAISDFFSNNIMAAQWRRRAAETAKSFSRERCAERMFRLYQSVIAEYKKYTVETDDLIPWDKLLRSLAAEWELISEKITATVNAFTKDA
jgi:glycosyltransferase involved in cell wall biosynthesis